MDEHILFLWGERQRETEEDSVRKIQGCGLYSETLTSDLCLNQEVPLRADVLEKGCHVDFGPLSDLPQHVIKDDVGARPAHTSTAGEGRGK